MRKLNNYMLLSFVLFILTIAGCSKDSSVDPEQSGYAYILIGEISDEFIETVSDVMNENLDRIKSDLLLNNIPEITLKIYQNEEEYFDYMEECIGERQYQYYVFVSASDEMVIQYTDTAILYITYELGHLLQLHINPTIKNNPYWLYESVALYECNYLVEPSTLQYMVEGDYPDFFELNDYATLNKYKTMQTGYVLVEFILSVYGVDNLISLIETNGDLQSVLELSENQFLEAWYDWIEVNYLN